MKNLSRLYWLVTAGAFGYLSFSISRHYSLWSDEVFTVTLASLPLPEFFQRLASDVHPPLYFLLVRIIAQMFGSAEIAARGLSLFFAFCSFYLFALLVRETEGEETSLWGLTFLTLSPPFYLYCFMARYYSFTFLLYLTSLFFWLKWRRGETRYEIWYLLSCLALVWTYFASAFLLLLHPLLFFWQRDNRWKWNLLIWVWSASTLLIWFAFLPDFSPEIHLTTFPGWMVFAREILLKIFFTFYDFLLGSFFPGFVWVGIQIVLIATILIPGIFTPGAYRQLWQAHIFWLVLFCIVFTYPVRIGSEFLPGRLFFLSFLAPLLLARGTAIAQSALPLAGFFLLLSRSLFLLPFFTAMFLKQDALFSTYVTPWSETAIRLEDIAKKYPDTYIVVDDPALEYYFSHPLPVFLFSRADLLNALQEEILLQIPAYLLLCWNPKDVTGGGYQKFLGWLQTGYTLQMKWEIQRESESVTQLKHFLHLPFSPVKREILLYHLRSPENLDDMDYTKTME